jgi:hypothetical protein
MTMSDPTARDWAIADPVTGVRPWGAEATIALEPRRAPYTIGLDESCAIRIADPSRRVSRVHAELRAGPGGWEVIDHASKNGLFVDGVRVAHHPLRPGMEIGLGSASGLWVDSAGVRTLRAALARMVGLGDSAMIDLALRGVRHAAQCRAVLVIAGEDNLVPLAREIHDLTLTRARPFVVCAPALLSETLRYPERKVPTAMAAVAEAGPGTVCLLHRMPPPDLTLLLASRMAAGVHTRLMVCAPNIRDVELFTGAAVAVPPIRTRGAEAPRLIEEYERLACHEYRVGPSPLTREEREWIAERATSLPELQRMVERVVATHAAGSLTAGAELLGMTHRALIKWLDQRGYPRRQRTKR